MGLDDYQGLTSDQKLTVLCVKMDNVERALEDRKGSWGPRTAWLMVGLTALSILIACIALAKAGG